MPRLSFNVKLREENKGMYVLGTELMSPVSTRLFTDSKPLIDTMWVIVIDLASLLFPALPTPL